MSDAEQPDVGEQPGVPPLARTTLDRSAHLRRDPAWLADAWKRGQVLVIDSTAGGVAPVRERDGVVDLVLLDSADAPDGERLFLGIDPDGTPLFSVDAPLPAVEGARGATLREVGELLDDRDAGVFSAAAALVNWHASHRYSPRSGELTTVTDGGWVREDPDGRQMWPRTDPAMIVLIHDGVPGPDGRCLLGHNASWPGTPGSRRFSTLAGFVEPGESLEAAVAREVYEEVGVQVVDISYVASQPWPFPASLMLGFSGRLAGDPGLHLDPVEMAEAGWFTRAEVARAAHWVDTDEPPDAGVRLQGVSPKLSISRFLIDLWLAGQI